LKNTRAAETMVLVLKTRETMLKNNMTYIDVGFICCIIIELFAV